MHRECIFVPNLSLTYTDLPKYFLFSHDYFASMNAFFRYFSVKIGLSPYSSALDFYELFWSEPFLPTCCWR